MIRKRSPDIDDSEVSEKRTRTVSPPHDMTCYETFTTPGIPVQMNTPITPSKPSIDRIRVVREIGSGTYARVYEVERDGKTYALKKQQLQDGLFNATAACAVIIREQEALMALGGHHNIITYHDAYHIGRNSYFLLDYVPTTLTSIIAAHRSLRKPMTAGTIRSIMRQILDGVKYAHESSFMHRDLKPCNILVRDDESPFICDWGMSTHIPPSGRVPLIRTVTTVWYRAPELMLSDTCSYGPEVDVWSAGCILAEMFALVPVHRGRVVNNDVSADDQLVAVHAPRAYWRHVPSVARNVLSRMLAVDPRYRISAADALKDPYFVEE